MSEQPDFSVVIPTWMREKVISRTIDSVLAQTHTSFEVLIIDNGGTDQTKSIIEAYKDPRLKYHWQEGSGSPANPRNTAIKMAKSDWICFLDSDDWWLPEKLEKVYQLIQNQPELDVFFHGMYVYKMEGNTILKKYDWEKPHYDDHGFLRQIIVNNNILDNSSVVARKSKLEQIGGINESRKLWTIEDFDCWIRIAQTTDAFHFISEPLGVRRLDGNNMTAYTLERATHSKELFEHYLNTCSQHFNEKDRQDVYSYLNYNFARSYHNEKHFFKAIQMYLKLFFSSQKSYKRLYLIAFCVFCLFRKRK